MRQRISDEDGRSAKARNYGRLALAAIPAALGGAVCLWIIAAMGWIDLTSKITITQRSLEAVGVRTPPVEPIKFIYKDAACLKVEDAYSDGGDHVAFIVRNSCNRWLQLPNFQVQTAAPDGTVLLSDKRWAFGGEKMIAPSERREQRVWLEGKDYGKLDPRTTKITITVFD